MSSEPEIFDYMDYRLFIADYYSFKKEQQGSKFSLSSIANKAGVSRMAIQHLIKASRHISLDQSQSVGQALNLKGKRIQYFQALIKFNKAKTISAKKESFSQLLIIKGSPLSDILLKDKQLGLFTDWYYPVIAEMIYFEGFQATPAWIRSRLHLKPSKSQIEKALEFLEEHDFLRRNPTGKGYQVPDTIRSQIYKTYCIKQAEKTADALAILSKDQREWETLTIAASKEKAVIAKQMIRDFSKQLRSFLSEPQKKECILQINLCLWQAAQLHPGEKHEK